MLLNYNYIKISFFSYRLFMLIFSIRFKTIYSHEPSIFAVEQSLCKKIDSLISLLPQTPSLIVIYMTPVRMREKESTRSRILISRKQRPLEAKKTQIITILCTGESILTYILYVQAMLKILAYA